MYSEERGIFKPSLKTHAMTNDVTIKRFSFTQHSQKQDNQFPYFKQGGINYEPLSYPSLDQTFPKDFNSNPLKQGQKQIKYPSLIAQNQTGLTATKFDPILPKILFKRYISNEQIPINQSKRSNSQLIQQLKVKNINYPIQVQKLAKQTQQKKLQYFRNFSSKISQNNQPQEVNWGQNSFQDSINQHTKSGLKKMPYFPLMGTDGKIFWSHSADKVVFWKYRNSQIQNPDVFCILNFEKQAAPISAIYATHVISPLFKNKKIILIAIAFFNQLQFYSFNIEKYETQFVENSFQNEKNEDNYKKYVEKILVKVNSNFFIEKILIQNVQIADSNNQAYPLILFTDGSRDLQIVDLSNLAAFKSHNQYDPIVRRQKYKQNKNQNQIIKLLHCKDQNRPELHYAFVLRKQTFENQVKPKSLIEKIKNILTFTKKYEKNQQMILSVYEWNQKQLKNQTFWKKLLNPPRVKKIKEVTSKDLETKLKQNFFQFFRLNANSQFLIADVSLVQRHKNYSIFESEEKSNCFLKVTFINGASVMISNFRTLTFVSKVMVNPYIEKCVPILSCQYQNYRGILQKGHYLQSQQEIKNKFNLYIYQPVDIEKQARYSSIDPVVSESNGLMICEEKLMYQDDQQISYKFHQCNSRKRINQIDLQRIGNNKSFMIFQNSFITLVETPNMGEHLLILGYLLQRHPQGKDKIRNYTRLLIEDMSENHRIQFLKSIIELLIMINNSGKKIESLNQNRMMLEDIVREFYGKEKRLDIDDTTYVEEKDNLKNCSEQVYRYECEIGKESYQNFVEYLLGSELASKEKQFLKERNSSYNGKSFQLKITEKNVNLLYDILIDQSLTIIPSKTVLKPTRTASMDKFYAESNTSEQIYLKMLVQGMSDVQETYMAAAISKFIVDLIRPLMNLPYESFHHIKSTTTWVLQTLDLLKIFIDKFIRYSSFKNYQSLHLAETVLLMKSLQNSLPKFSLLIKLFDALSELHFYNTTSLNTISNSNLTLLNFLFKLDPKEKLSQMTVQNLFEQNAIFLDEIEQKLPQLNEIKYLRYFKGWKKINSLILESTNNKANIQKQKVVEPSWGFNFFTTNNNNKSINGKNITHPFQSEQNNLKDQQLRQREQSLQIQKSLNQYTFEDFQKYFINKNQFLNFTNIVLSKIYFLQINYLQLKNKYLFQDGLYDTLQSFTTNTSQIPSKPNIKPQLSSFLKYEQKIHNHQKYLKIYQLIKFLNDKLSLFIGKTFEIYNQQILNSSKELLSTENSKSLKHSFVDQSFSNYQASSNKDYAHILGQQVQRMVDLLMQKGSQFIKNQLQDKIKLSPTLEPFLKKYKTQTNYPSQKSQLSTGFYDGKQYLLKDHQKQLSNQQKQQILFDNQRKQMYLQKIEQQITIQSKQPYRLQNNINWMKSHNGKSSLNFSNEQF